MWTLWAALIAAGAAIISSALTSSLTHYFEHKRRKRQYELKWLEERFTPALDFLGRVYAIISNAPNTEEGRRQTAAEIGNVVVGSSKESNAWCIAVLLDPEETGLSDLIHSAMTYARIGESEEGFRDYQIRVHLGLKELAEEFRRERQAITSGKSLESLISGRKREIEERMDRMTKILHALRTFLDGKADLDSTLREVKISGVRGTGLNRMFEIVSNAADQQNRGRLGKVREACEKRGWLA